MKLDKAMVRGYSFFIIRSSFFDEREKYFNPDDIIIMKYPFDIVAGV
jgi:hypothetical protein